MANEQTLSVQAERHEKAAIVCPSGRVDGSNVEVLESAIQEQLAAGEKKIVFDFEHLVYISSAGLRTLLVAARRLQTEGGAALFCGLAEHIAHIFEISGFNSILTVYESRDEALSSL
jgi:stage II sporulation protein AA (anti-sigma F factor antagonist)